MTAKEFFPALLVLALGTSACAAEIDLTRAVVVTTHNLRGPAAKAVQMLSEEVEVRTMVRWNQSEKWPVAGTSAIVVGSAEQVRKLLDERGIRLEGAVQVKPEGYQIGTARDGTSQIVWVAGNDARGVLFGIGRLLRELRLGRSKITLPDGFQETSAPTTLLRGHQLGYRPKTNSYD